MKLSALRTLLAISASVTVVSGAMAATWDATADFTPAGNSGAWTYGYTTVTNVGWASTALDVNNYTFTADTYQSPTPFNDYGGACSIVQWAKSATGNTNWGSNGEPLAWTGLNTGGASGWANGTPSLPVFPGAGLYVQPYAIGDNNTGQATVLRWTAPAGGTYNLTGSVYDCLNGGLVDQLIKTDGSGNRTVLHSVDPGDGTHLASRATDAFSGSVTLGAGETVDLIVYQSPVYLREYGEISLTFSSVPEPASLGLLALGSMAVLRRRRRA